jgi:hypothetical protein
MPSLTYKLFEQAMRGRQQVVCMYGGHRRELCPVILGHSQDQEKALTFQFGGSSSSGLRAGENGAACGSPRSATWSFATDRGSRAPATPSRRDASTSSISM